MNRDYELFYIIRPDLEEEQVRATMDEIGALLAGHGGEVSKSSLWGRRHLAYTIAGFRDGYYVLNEMALPAEKVRELERQLGLDERVIRHLISLRQVYFVPGEEDRRGRGRGRGRGRNGAGAPESAGSADGGEGTEGATAEPLAAQPAVEPEAESEAESEVELVAAETASSQDGEE